MSLEQNLNDFHISNEDCEKQLSNLNDKVNSLYKLRDRYLETRPISEAINKNKDVEIELNTTIKLFDEFKNCAVNSFRSRYYFLKGRALNVTQDYSKEAQDLLSKAVKLDPKLIEAWNELGECYWKNDNLTESKNCFTKALEYKRNKISLRNLSMVARQEVAYKKEDKIKNIELGVTLAKEAVQLDANDGLSWAVLGNAHLSSFFVISQNPKTLKQCMSAYVQAEKDIIAKLSPDLHYNKAVTLKYEEEYLLALESFSQAQLLDPVWDAPKIKQQQLLKYLDNVTDMINTTGKMKGKKRLHQILNSIDSKQLGPYAGGSYQSGLTNTEKIKLTELKLSELKEGINLECVVLGKVVCSVRNDDSVPFTFCMVDKMGTCVSVTVYNLAEGKGVIIGDSVAIPEPFVTDVKFSYNDKNYNFRSIRVETPLVLVVNSKKLGRDQQASVQMSILKDTKKTE